MPDVDESGRGFCFAVAASKDVRSIFCYQKGEPGQAEPAVETHASFG
jgi:hypothetical protein